MLQNRDMLFLKQREASNHLVYKIIIYNGMVPTNIKNEILLRIIYK